MSASNQKNKTLGFTLSQAFLSGCLLIGSLLAPTITSVTIIPLLKYINYPSLILYLVTISLVMALLIVVGQIRTTLQELDNGNELYSKET